MHCIAKYMTTSLAKKNQSDRNSVTDTHPPIPNVDNRERCFLGDKGAMMGLAKRYSGNKKQSKSGGKWRRMLVGTGGSIGLLARSGQ